MAVAARHGSFCGRLRGKLPVLGLFNTGGSG